MRILYASEIVLAVFPASIAPPHSKVSGLSVFSRKIRVGT
jgi:hypothetical protein